MPLVRRSHAIWRALEEETGEALMQQCGLLIMARRGSRAGHHGKADFLARTVAVARRYSIPHEQLDGAAIAARFPAFRSGEDEGYFEPGGGFVYPERCIAAQLRSAAEAGAAVLTGRAGTQNTPAGRVRYWSRQARSRSKPIR